MGLFMGFPLMDPAKTALKEKMPSDATIQYREEDGHAGQQSQDDPSDGREETLGIGDAYRLVPATWRQISVSDKSPADVIF